jgi:cysteine desulfuration protein SufE
MTINDIQDEIIDEFSMLEDPLDKTQYIIDLGKKLPPLPEQFRDEEHRIMGCQSKVWLGAERSPTERSPAEPDGDTIRFFGDAEPTAQISKGLISLLIRVLSGQKPDEIANADLYFIDAVGMKHLVTSLRAGGLASMMARMKQYGRELTTAQNQA